MIADILRSEPSESESSEMNSTSDELRENSDMDSSSDDTAHPAFRDTRLQTTVQSIRTKLSKEAKYKKMTIKTNKSPVGSTDGSGA